MIFVTLGSQKFPFDRLLKKIDELVADGTIEEEVFAQTGYSEYRPRNYSYQPFLERDTFAEQMGKAGLVITHAGTGAIIGAAKRGKKVIAVPRQKKYGEHVDDHQFQIVEQFEEMNIIEPCYDVEQLAEAYRKAQTKAYAPYVSNTQTILESLETYLESLV